MQQEDRRFIAFESTIAREAEAVRAADDIHYKSKPVKSRFSLNFIKTSRYTAVSFVPVSLLLQFKRYANIYFLAIAILQSIPIISPLSAYVAIAPLIFVLCVSMAREGFEDYARHRSDKEQNYGAKAQRVVSLSDRSEKTVTWAEIEVGDILRIQKDECFPADLLVLGSNLEGICYIETGALDGEKNLKPKSALVETAGFFDTSEQNSNNAGAASGQIHSNNKPLFNSAKNNKFSLSVFAKSPDPDPNHFVGSIAFSQSDNNTNSKSNTTNLVERSSDQNQLLPRGAFLRNTESIYGIVVYTGMDTKIMRNAEEAKPKSSDMESSMNVFILCILIFQLLCAFIMSWCNYYWLRSNEGMYPYLYLNKGGYSNSAQAVIAFFSYFILFNTMIPISLIVSLEMVKVMQSYFITNDAEMYSAHNDKWPRVLTSTINEELGQIEYIFSDKTGTLTQNKMMFKMALIGSILYGEHPNYKNSIRELENAQQQQDEFLFQDDQLEDLLNIDDRSSNYLPQGNNHNVNLTLTSVDGKAEYKIKSQLDLAREYFSLLSLTHECIVEKKKQNNGTEKVAYQGPSPDEITLVDAAYHMGFTFTGKTSESLLVEIAASKNSESQHPTQKSVRKINVFEFSSARKRNTLILEDSGVYKMYIKGADNVVKERLRTDIHQPFLKNADAKLTEFSVVGLRTLLIGMKVMSKAEVEEFLSKFNALASSPNRNEELEKLADQVERGFFLLGATAVEDKLQDGVPETIEDLLRANIKVWMLTGDKLETAENIAKSCRLIREDFQLLVLSNKNPSVIRIELMDVLWNRFKHYKQQKIRKCFLVEGDCLRVIFDEKNEDLKKKFVQITKECESVVCCRVSPVQKAQVVRAIKEGLNKITLAIGDGANDVNMIQSAHIGCGIYGNEGMRAVQSSDFAFGEFQCLWRLVFVHGRWSYIRISEMIVYFFYKNMIFTIPQLFFAFYCGFSAQTVFDDVFISLYNLVFTALPLIIRAILDQDVNYMYLPQWKNQAELSMEEEQRMKRLMVRRKTYVREKLPLLYYVGQQKQLFTTRSFLEWVSIGFLHGLIIFYLAYFAVGDHIYEDDGFASDMWSFSLIIFTSVVFIANVKLAINTRYWTVLNHVAFYVTSFGLYILAFFVLGVVSTNNVYQTPNYLVQTPHFYLVIFGVVASIFGIDLAILAITDLFVDRTKEKALRKLMKSIPKKAVENNRWVFGGSMLEIESNLMSFVEKNGKEDSVRTMSRTNSQRLIVQPVHKGSTRDPISLEKQESTQPMQAAAVAAAATSTHLGGNNPGSDLYSIKLIGSSLGPAMSSLVATDDKQEVPLNKKTATLQDVYEKERKLQKSGVASHTPSRSRRLVFTPQQRSHAEDIDIVPEPVYNIALTISDNDEEESGRTVQSEGQIDQEDYDGVGNGYRYEKNGQRVIIADDLQLQVYDTQSDDQEENHGKRKNKRLAEEDDDKDNNNILYTPNLNSDHQLQKKKKKFKPQSLQQQQTHQQVVQNTEEDYPQTTQVLSNHSQQALHPNKQGQKYYANKYAD